MDILLVDDEEHILKIIADFLADCGYQTVTAANGTEALKCLERGADIGLIVSDIRMPKMDGLEFLRSVRRGSGHLFQRPQDGSRGLSSLEGSVEETQAQHGRRR